jgi:DNA-binding beta-propeller fold protein YncE
MTMNPKTIAAACLLSLLIMPAARAADPQLTQRWTFGDAGRWDYLDVEPLRHRLFLSRADRVQVLDLPSGAVAGEIPNTSGVHGIAFAQDFKLGFTSNGRTDSVTVFDLDTLKVKQEVKVSGNNPDAILYAPASHKLFTFNGKSADVSVFEVPSMKLVATIKVSGKPEFAVSDNANRVYVNIEDKSQIDVIDVAAAKVIAHWPLPGCDEPTGLAIDHVHARLFSVCQNRAMVVTDAGTGAHVAQVAIGEHPDAAIYDPATATVFSSNGAGTLSLIRQIDADHYAPARELATEKSARTMAFDPASQQIYLPASVDKIFTVLVVKP